MLNFFSRNSKDKEIKLLRQENARLREQLSSQNEDNSGNLYLKSQEISHFLTTQLKILLSEFPLPVYMFNPDNFACEYSNSGTKNHPHGGYISRFVQPDKIREANTNNLTLEEEYCYGTGTYEERFFKIFYSPFKAENIQLVIVTGYDISKYKKQHVLYDNQLNYLHELLQHRAEELRIAEERANEAEKLKSAFLTNLSHELRTPMNAVIGFSSLLDDDTLEKADRHLYISQIQDSAKSLLSLINDILDVAKIEIGEIELENNHFHIDKLLRDLFLSFKSAREKVNKEHIDIRLNAAENIRNILIRSDASKIQQVLAHLLNNALKFTDEGYIEFGCRIDEDGKKLLCYVRDTGIGICEDKINIIFDPFRKIEDNKLRIYGGAGIGLSISKKIIEMLGGEIWLESTPLAGTTFYFTVPVEQSVKSEPDATSADIKTLRWPNKKILVVEDKELSFVYLRDIFAHTGVQLIWARDGEKAVNICKQNQDIDLVLMDIRMPGMDGFETYREIKQLLKKTPVIAQSAFTLIREKDSLLNAGFDDFIPKFISSKDLLNKVHKYIAVNQN